MRPPVVLAQTPFLVPVLAAVPAAPFPTAVATQPAFATADDNCMSDMQAMFTPPPCPPYSAPNALVKGMRSMPPRDTSVIIPRRPHRSLVLVLHPCPRHSFPRCPRRRSDAPSAPARRPNDPAREFIFGSVKWKSDINAEARTIIAEGMTSSLNMCAFFTRRGPDIKHIVCGCESAGGSSTPGWLSAPVRGRRSSRPQTPEGSA
ncbi:hypothetical protein DFH09DRAFT_591396 [Mycena vulgaris]|nr:hypothetical protein DFH09DRAFT_591396 [Mycena vulgaris]